MTGPRILGPMQDANSAKIAPISLVRDDADAAETPRVRDALALGCLIVIVLAVLAVNFWSRYNLYRLDIVTFYIPWYEHLGSRLRDFDIPGWMPYAMSGSPFAGDPQSGWGYLPAMVIFTIAPSLSGYIAFVAFHVLLAAAGAYLYARIIGIGPVGAFAAGATFTLGNFMERTACCTIHMQVAVWIPVIFLCYELSRRSRSIAGRYGWLVAAGIGTGQMIAGWVGQGAYYGCLAVGVYLLYRTFLNRNEFKDIRDRLRSLALTALVVGVVGVATAGPALVPRLSTVSRSNLADLYEGEEGSESGWSIASVPFRIFSDTSSTMRWYLGAAVLTAAIAGACLAVRRRHGLFFILYGLGVMSLILARSPLSDLLSLLPKFSELHIHSPDRVYVVLFLAPAVLAGWLVHTVLDPKWRPRSYAPAAICAVVLPTIALVAAIAIIEWDRDIRVRTDQIRNSALVIVAVATGLLIRKQWARRLAAVAVILLLLYDPAGALVRERIENDNRREQLTTLVDDTLTANGAALWLQERARSGELFRYFGYDQVQLMADGRIEAYHAHRSEPETLSILVLNRGIQFHLYDVQGYNPVQIDRYVELITAVNGVEQTYHAANVLASGLDSPLLNQLNIRYIVVPRDLPPGRPDLLHLTQRYPTVYADDQARILQNPNALPRAWIAHNTDEEETDDDILTKFSLGLADPSKSVLLTTESPELEQPADASAESVEITSYEPDEIRLTVTATATGMVVLSEIWDPGWEATIDGKATEVYRANAVLRGVIVTSGTHEIVLTYPANTVKYSLLLYLIPIAALLAIPVIGRRPGQ
jgi:hypothetical protein